jgi:hypothetical protein
VHRYSLRRLSISATKTVHFFAPQRIYILFIISARRTTRVGVYSANLHNGSVPMNLTRPIQIPDTFTPASLANELRLRIAGAPADGSVPAPLSSPVIVWADAGSEALVHLDSIQVRMLPGTLLVSLDFETDQTGRSPLIVALTLSADPKDPAGLVAATDEYPRGDGRLAARWGRAFQAAAWASLLSIAQDHAAQRSLAPRNISVGPNGLTLQAGPPLSIVPQPTPQPGRAPTNASSKSRTKTSGKA